MKRTFSHSHRTLCLVLLVLTVCGTAVASAPFARTQAPGFFRMPLGRFEITALYDGAITGDAAILHNLAPAELQRELARFFITDNKVRLVVNAFLVNTNEKLVLVDAGFSSAFGPAIGRLTESIRAAGYTPEQIDAVLITHLHGDHFTGLLDAEQRPVFANAVVYVAKAESDFFLSAENAARAPAERKRGFDMARQAAAPYQAAGRWQTFQGADLPLNGIKALAIPGHTPGHTAYEIRSEGQALVVWGDLVHVMAVQMAKPGVSLEYDQDQKQAVVVRLPLLRRLAAEKTLVAGMHMPFPGIGRLRPEGTDTYTWVPVEYIQ